MDLDAIALRIVFAVAASTCRPRRRRH
eukprot:SAG11_NODE_15576_length_573_cov_1.021097_1_plen_26_part_10